MLIASSRRMFGRALSRIFSALVVSIRQELCQLRAAWAIYTCCDIRTIAILFWCSITLSRWFLPWS